MIGKIFHAFSNDWKKFSRNQYHPQRPKTRKRKPIENANVFRNLTSHPAPGSRMIQKPRDASSEAFASLPGVRHLAAPWRTESGRTAHAKSAKAAKGSGGEREGRTHAEARRRGGLGGGRILHKRTKRKQKGRLECGRKVSIENHENRFADMEKGSKAAVQSGRGRPAREAAGRRKTSGKGNVFRNLITRGRCWGKMKKSRPPRGRCLFGYVGPVQGGCGEGGGWWRGGYSRPKRRKSFEVSPEAMPSMEMEVPETVTAASVASRHVPESRSSVT